jgi:hypothetical protein
MPSFAKECTLDEKGVVCSMFSVPLRLPALVVLALAAFRLPATHPVTVPRVSTSLRDLHKYALMSLAGLRWVRKE